jgi:tRNA(fMet)-specific endonuclease VapC
MTAALDTNIISFWIKGLYEIEAGITKALLNGDIIVIPPVTYYEVLRGLYADNAQRKLELFRTLCEQFGVKEMDTKTWEEAARLYAESKRSARSMGDNDLLQAAFCLRHHYTLVTNNTKHFEGIANLNILDWVKR